MKVELFPFQKRAVSDLRIKVASALYAYNTFGLPQVISLQAPTGAGKTIIMAALVESILFGDDRFAEQPDAIFVWLSDSPALNDQSRQKFDLKADKIRIGQCITIEDNSFDMEMLEDGHIYFLNTQKLGINGKLCAHSNSRQYTIWETLENTAKEKSNRLYFIIDEAHRGMQGKAASVATSIMQRFLKGSKEHGLSAMPLVIGVSATAERFNALVKGIDSGFTKCEISPNDVRASGLLKDRIVITYPDDSEKNNEMAVLHAATDEWKKKCEHWYQYSYEQHYAQVNPVFLIQVLAGNDNKVSNTNLDDVLASIEERSGILFKEHEVAHTFGSTSTLMINGLPVHHVDPANITDDRRIRVVFFKENLSTGWDCPRAETMMSFRHAKDVTYIAQLLGRMVRTPLQCHILVDDYLNDVRLFLPYFNMDSVKEVITALQESEGSEIPTEIDGESIECPVYTTLSIRRPKQSNGVQVEGQINIGELTAKMPGSSSSPFGRNPETGTCQREVHPQIEPTPMIPIVNSPEKPSAFVSESGKQMKIPNLYFDREELTQFINNQGLLNYKVSSVQINNYLKSLLSLAGLLTQNNIYAKANADVKSEIINMIRSYIEELHRSNRYDDLAKQVLSFKLSVRIFDVFGTALDKGMVQDLFTASDSDLDRQVRAADAVLGGCGIQNEYGRAYYDDSDPNAFKVDCVLFAADDGCIASLNKYAKEKFHDLNDKYRKYIVKTSDKCQKQYSSIVTDSDIVSKHIFMLPEGISVRVDDGGKDYDNHLFIDEKTGVATFKLNNWEKGVLEEESNRSDFVCWIRNVPKASWALRIPYETAGETKAMYPDFLIVRTDSQLEYVIDILEPHAGNFADNLAKAKGLARYANEEPQIGRVQLIRMATDLAGKNRFKRLDFSKGTVREKVLRAVTNEEFNHIFDVEGFFD